MQRNFQWLGIPVLAALAVLASVWLVAGEPSFHGTAIKPPTPAAEINLADHNGHAFRMSDMRGKLVLVYFGFVNCPDECPLTMAHLKQALEMLGPRSQDVQVVLVTTDPVRDTPQALRDFLGKFDPTFLGIPGTPDELARVWKDYGVVVLDGGETHSDFTYVVDSSGNLRLTFLPDTSAQDIAADLKILLAEKSDSRSG